VNAESSSGLRGMTGGCCNKSVAKPCSALVDGGEPSQEDVGGGPAVKAGRSFRESAAASFLADDQLARPLLASGLEVLRRNRMEMLSLLSSANGCDGTGRTVGAGTIWWWSGSFEVLHGTFVHYVLSSLYKQ
jgi:hypothetical protein